MALHFRCDFNALVNTLPRAFGASLPRCFLLRRSSQRLLQDAQSEGDRSRRKPLKVEDMKRFPCNCILAEYCCEAWEKPCLIRAVRCMARISAFHWKCCRSVHLNPGPTYQQQMSSRIAHTRKPPALAASVRGPVRVLSIPAWDLHTVTSSLDCSYSTETQTETPWGRCHGLTSFDKLHRGGAQRLLCHKSMLL